MSYSEKQVAAPVFSYIISIVSGIDKLSNVSEAIFNLPDEFLLYPDFESVVIDVRTKNILTYVIDVRTKTNRNYSIYIAMTKADIPNDALLVRYAKNSPNEAIYFVIEKLAIVLLEEVGPDQLNEVVRLDTSPDHKLPNFPFHLHVQKGPAVDFQFWYENVLDLLNKFLV